MLRRGQAAGEVRRDIDVNAAAAAMVAMLQGLVLQKLWDPALEVKAVSDVSARLIESWRA